MTSVALTAPSPSLTSASPAYRPLTGVEDLTVFYGLTKTYKRYARDTPPTYEHLVAHIPGPPLFTSTSAHVADKSTLLLPLSYPPQLPEPLAVRAVTQRQAESVLTFSVGGELGVVRAEMAGRAERVQRIAEERNRRRQEKKGKKGEKRKQADGGAGYGEDGKRPKLESGGAMVDIS